jgi:serine/threonine protein kinase
MAVSLLIRCEFEAALFSRTYRIILAAVLERERIFNGMPPQSLTDLCDMPLLGRGATGLVYKVTDTMVVKLARKGADEQKGHANEQRMFEMIEENPGKIPYLIECHHRTPHVTFLQFASGGDLAVLLNKYQKRDEQNGWKVLEITQALDSQDIDRWMEQLCDVAATLERLGLAHNDIRPGNMLLDAERNLKLADLDRGTKVGEDIQVLTEPFGRLLNKSEGIDAGSYGKAGARTEIFAIGSVFYSLLRGYEPYETEYWGDDHGVILSEKFQNKEFPHLAESVEDNIIRKCWHGEYGQVKDLLHEVKSKNMRTRRVGCEKLIKSGAISRLGSS